MITKSFGRLAAAWRRSGKESIMAEYEKPVILVDGECSEGVYLASGEPGTEGGGYACESKYINGNWQPVSTSHWTGDGKKIIDRGCEGCPAYNEAKCNRNESWFQISGDKHLMPAWESAGKNPDDPWDSWWG